MLLHTCVHFTDIFVVQTNVLEELMDRLDKADS
jgi:hypothetical protein